MRYRSLSGPIRDRRKLLVLSNGTDQGYVHALTVYAVVCGRLIKASEVVLRVRLRMCCTKATVSSLRKQAIEPMYDGDKSRQYSFGSRSEAAWQASHNDDDYGNT